MRKNSTPRAGDVRTRGGEDVCRLYLQRDARDPNATPRFDRLVAPRYYGGHAVIAWTSPDA